MKRSRTVKLTREARERFNLSPDAARRGLSALELAGLVSVERHPGRRALVTILVEMEVAGEKGGRGGTPLDRLADTC
jgi:hypothetical protein